MSPTKFNISVGTTDLDSDATIYGIKEYIPHERYDRTDLGNDIALVRIGGSIEFNAKVQPIKYSSNIVQPGENVQVSGWGLLSVSLFKITFEVITH